MVVSVTRSTIAQAHLVRLTAIIKTEIAPIPAIETTIAGIAIEIVGIVIAIREYRIIRGIGTVTATVTMNVVKQIGAADLHGKSACILLIANETVGVRTDQLHAIVDATHRILILVITTSSIFLIQQRNFWNFTSTRKLKDTIFAVFWTRDVLHRA